MRISVERPPFPHSTPVCGASVCASPATSALCGPPLLMLLAWSTAGELAGSAEICARGDTEHAAHVGVLRLANPADYVTGTALLRHAVDTVPRLRRGGALLAGASDASQLDALHSLGFGPSAAPAPEASDQGVESPSELIFLSRREPGVPPAECSHTAVHVSSIVKWVDFFSLLGYEPSLIFSTSGARAAWVTAPWSQATIELIEVPKLLQQQRGGSAAGQLAGPVGGVGLVHVCLDLTPRCTSLCLLLEYLSAESQARWAPRGGRGGRWGGSCRKEGFWRRRLSHVGNAIACQNPHSVRITTGFPCF